jgi:hypothetical protein
METGQEHMDESPDTSPIDHVALVDILDMIGLPWLPSAALSC